MKQTLFIAFSTQKGGVDKTLTSINMSENKTELLFSLERKI